MNTISIPKCTASLCIGMRKGYTDQSIELNEIKKILREIQEIQIKREQLYLSANVYLSAIVLSGHVEPHFNLSFIQYPRFPASEIQLRDGVLEIGAYLMDKLQQNRIVITFDNEIIMLENSREIDKKITFV
ncbi:MAG: hypothetical protein IPL09_07535 [Bacteroidetes bacterium]|nr:hypothetical protein [Bacteroidota bacterium]